ncbi:MAG: hypothetical protein A3E07_02415 [Candidatus Wildermuthbacteria bacterium RIFCSPHIGHO2_12_FULL_45_9]|uniref:Magnesium transporter CorA n=1 Tax=Candidatus Wildermuthbacteria bacterium RIFCSPHIGHO2_02_FULL_45_25 TaxID=1802450 RepID=A0A1G2R2G4_9BACT|nr:MAG: hypothetical protein A2748_01895 [Candidatus Wildermuthbacteria bacterium RIFCSPHIGHO2_01_FULL_45_20]OHA66983.1 MAG: hypothetical protein A3C04_04360 [Candidatus Wildermuthbacteria bacterium RIFCSPHIGHO2_02_FULL_45_25]OHA71325.1 MAG: hypothetical protein A3E07_02415 [Candidatus Wildermuthbacteria bacterium RIFCSPHIGHO2_12_FULL_45_9]
MLHVIKGSKVTWIDISNPIKEDIEFLQNAYPSIHPLTLGELIPPGWRVKAEAFPSYLFLITYYPVYSKEHKHTRGRELDIIVGKDFLITSHYNSIVPLKALFDKCNLYDEAKQEYLSSTGGYLLFHALDQLKHSSLLKLDRISKKLHLIEEQIFLGNDREMLREISYTKADIINFWRILHPQGDLFISLKKESVAFFGKELEPYFTHLLGDWSQTHTDLEAYKETIASLEQTNNALLADKTNQIVKILTIFSVIMFPLMVMPNLFGMNTHDLPLTGYTGDFWIILGIILSGILAIISYFKFKRWI